MVDASFEDVVTDDDLPRLTHSIPRKLPGHRVRTDCQPYAFFSWYTIYERFQAVKEHSGGRISALL